MRKLDRIKLLHNRISVEGIKREGIMLSATGQRRIWMLDIRTVLFDALYLDLVTDHFWDEFEKKLPFQIGGIETASTPLVIGLLLKAKERGLDTQGFIIRKERKTYGFGRSYEGAMNDLPVVFVDDVLNSGQGADKARAVIEQEGRHIRYAFVVLDFRSDAGLAWRKKHGVEVTSIFSKENFDLESPKPTKAPTQEFKLRWKYSSPDPFPYYVVPKSTPLVVDGLIYFGTDTGVFRAVNLMGELAWEFPTQTGTRKGIWSSPAHHAGRVYFGSYDGSLYCLDAKTGKEVWQHHLCEWIGSSPLIIPKHDLIVVGLEYERPTSKGSMAAFSLDGSKRWERYLKNYQHGSCAYWEEGDLIVYGASDHSITAVGPKGQEVWKVPTLRTPKYAPRIDPVRKLAVVASFDSYIYIVQLGTGKVLAKFKTGNGCYTTPLVVGHRAFCGSGDRHLYVIDLDELELIKKIPCGATVYAPPALVDGKVAFGNHGGVYREVDPVSLEVTGRLQLPDAITNAVTPLDGGRGVLIPTYMNELYYYERT
jgi:outer membrane protein assembly factor BamB/orotate phosphoribosyltransferase